MYEQSFAVWPQAQVGITGAEPRRCLKTKLMRGRSGFQEAKPPEAFLGRQVDEKIPLWLTPKNQERLDPNDQQKQRPVA